MKNRFLGGCALAAALIATPAMAQFGGGRFSVEPYVTYGFYGDLPESDITLEAAPGFGGRAAYNVADQWTVFANYQRSLPAMTLEGTDDDLGEMDVDHWSTGVEFSYIPRGGAEGMIPLFFEAGLGQVRYENGPNHFAVNLGIASGLQLTPAFAVRYGANDYISNYNDGGLVNQIFVNLGVEIRM
jgi:hypothetical protein